MASSVNPKIETAHFEYDLVGNLAAFTHFDGTREQASFDLASRLSARVRPDGTRLTFDRDPVGNLLQLSAVDRENGQIALRTFSTTSAAAQSKGTSDTALSRGVFLYTEVALSRSLQKRTLTAGGVTALRTHSLVPQAGIGLRFAL